jgi:hypothetical protein
MRRVLSGLCPPARAAHILAMEMRVGHLAIEIDDDVAAELEEERRARDNELARVALAISGLRENQREAAWNTYRALVADRTDKAVAISIATAEQEGLQELAAAYRAEWDKIKRERKRN